MNKVWFFISIIICAFTLTGCGIQNSNQSPANSSQPSVNSNQNTVNAAQSSNQNVNVPVATNTHTTVSEYAAPLDRPTERITKKPFGIHITPATSPIQPERFSGYHTAVDFEIFSGEENAVVIVKAFCSGEVVYKKWVSGYGGLFIQQCTVAGQAVTVLYGHLKLSSITAAVGDSLQAGDIIGELGQAGSHDTDGERKHLHFGLHKGTTINVRGYANNESDLNNWLDPKKYL
jgi:murein DD-endopeptidase MepM/ murein hydrolase activator NlpD